MNGERSSLTGCSSVSLNQPSVTNTPLRPTNKWPVSVTGDNLRVQGERSVSFAMKTVRSGTFISFARYRLLHKAFGLDFLAGFGANSDFRNTTLALYKHITETMREERELNSYISSGSPHIGGLITLRTPTPQPHGNLASIIETTDERPRVFTQEFHAANSGVPKVASEAKAEQCDNLISQHLWMVRSLENVNVPCKCTLAVHAKLVGSNPQLHPA
jgi:hypothetical protein